MIALGGQSSDSRTTNQVTGYPTPSTSITLPYEPNLQAGEFSPAMTFDPGIVNIYEGDYADLLNSTDWMLDDFNNFTATVPETERL